VLCVGWLLLWMIGDPKKRWTLGLGFCLSLTALIWAGNLLVPGWPRDFFAGLAAYERYFPTTSPIRLALGNWIGWPVSAILLIVLCVLAWQERGAAARSTEFIRMLSLVFLASALVLPLLTPYNQVLLLLPMVVILRDWNWLSRTG